MNEKENQDEFMKTFTEMLKENGAIPCLHPKTVECERFIEVMKQAESMNRYGDFKDTTTFSDYNQGWQDAVDFIWREIGVGYV